MYIHWPSFGFGFLACAVTPLIDIIAVWIMHEFNLK